MKKKESATLEKDCIYTFNKLLYKLVWHILLLSLVLFLKFFFCKCRTCGNDIILLYQLVDYDCRKPSDGQILSSNGVQTRGTIPLEIIIKPLFVRIKWVQNFV